MPEYKKLIDAVKDIHNSYCRDMPQRPTANINHHNHGRRWWKWPSSAPHEAFCPALMRRSNRGQPPNQADAFLLGLGGYSPAAATTATATANPPPLSVAIFLYQTMIGYMWIHKYEFIGHQGYEFILLMYEFISGGAVCEVSPSLWPGAATKNQDFDVPSR